MPSSIRSINLGALYGIHAFDYNTKGDVRIDSNYISNFSSFNADSTKGAIIAGVWIQGAFFAGEDVGTNNIRVKNNMTLLT